MRLPVLTAMLALSACSSHDAGNPGADVNAAAAQAQGDIDTYAANTLTPAPVLRIPATAPVPATVPVGSRPGTVTEEPFTEDGARDAADVVQTYFALIGGRKYGQAWQLWDDGGRASGMTRRQFADSFAKYAVYRAKVGSPGRVDAGAGQRYVEVSVRVYGTLADRQRPFAMRGSVTLHRTAAIDGATPEQKSWRIRKSSLLPGLTEAADAGSETNIIARYRCAGTTRFSVRFDEDADTATIQRGDRDLAVLKAQPVGSGIWYRGGGYELRGKGDDAAITAPGRPPVACTAAD